MVVLPTLSEDDLKDIGVVSFGTRRKITVLVKKLNQPLVEPSASLVCFPLDTGFLDNCITIILYHIPTFRMNLMSKHPTTVRVLVRKTKEKWKVLLPS